MPKFIEITGDTTIRLVLNQDLMFGELHTLVTISSTSSLDGLGDEKASLFSSMLPAKTAEARAAAETDDLCFFFELDEVEG